MSNKERSNHFELPMMEADSRSIRRRRLVQGVGINDVGYKTSWRDIEGKVHRCPFYTRWCSILSRCFSTHFHKKNPTYKDATICQEWLYLSNFKLWMESQDWVGKDLDKDIITYDNKLYSPETCVFVDKSVNLLLSTKIKNKGDYKRGVSITKKGKFLASCNNGVKGVAIGYYDTEQEAYIAYVRYKSDLIIKVSREQEDIRVREGLLLHSEHLLATLNES